MGEQVAAAAVIPAGKLVGTRLEVQRIGRDVGDKWTGLEVMVDLFLLRRYIFSSFSVST